MKKRIVILMLLFIGVVLIGWGAAYLRALHVRQSAEAALQDVRELAAGTSDFGDVQRLSNHYANYLKPSVHPCDPSHCDIILSFDNRWLKAVRFSPGTLFTISISVKDERIRWVSILMSTDSGARAYVEQFPAENVNVPYDIDAKLQSSPPWHANLIAVKFTPNATGTQKAAALGFNLTCITKFQGCKYGEAMLPTVYKELKNRDRFGMAADATRR